MSESIKIILKQKSIPTLVDFCVEEKIEFSVKPQSFPDVDWEFNLFVKDIKTGVLTGMFLRENRIDVAGTDPQKLKKPIPKKGKEEEDKPQTYSEPADLKAADPEEKGLF
jgi:hypothetical protein